MAHGILNQLVGDKANVYSAGIETHGVNPRAILSMQEIGIDIAHHTSNNVNEYLDIPFDYMITVCDHANENCPYIPGNGLRLHHNFPDPAKAKGTEEEIMQSFRDTRGLIEGYLKDFVEKYLGRP